MAHLSTLVHATSRVLDVANTLGDTPAMPGVQWPQKSGEAQKSGETQKGAPSPPYSPRPARASHLCRGVVTGSQSGTARVWDLDGNCRLSLDGHGRPVLSACCSPDGSLVLTAAGNRLWLWDAATATVRRTFDDVHTARVNAAVFSPCGQEIVSAAEDGKVRVTCCRTGRCLAELKHEAPVSFVACSPDGGTVASFSGDGTPHGGLVRLWRPDTGECLHSLAASWCRPSFSADGSMLVFLGGDHEACLHSVESGELIHSFRAPFNGLVPHHFDCGVFVAVAISPDGRLVLTVSMNKDLRIWSRRSGECVQRVREGSNHWATFSEDSRQVLAWPDESTAQLWDLRKGQCEATLQVLEDMTIGEAAYFQLPVQKANN